MNDDKTLLTPGEVAEMLRVDPKTVTRWADRGLILSIRTPGGHHRFRKAEIDAIVSGEATADATDTGTSPHWAR